MTSAVRRAVEAARRAASEARSDDENNDRINRSNESHVVVSVNEGGSSRVSAVHSTQSARISQKDG